MSERAKMLGEPATWASFVCGNSEVSGETELSFRALFSASEKLADETVGQMEELNRLHKAGSISDEEHNRKFKISQDLNKRAISAMGELNDFGQATPFFLSFSRDQGFLAQIKSKLDDIAKDMKEAGIKTSGTGPSGKDEPIGLVRLGIIGGIILGGGLILTNLIKASASFVPQKSLPQRSR